MLKQAVDYLLSNYSEEELDEVIINYNSAF